MGYILFGGWKGIREVKVVIFSLVTIKYYYRCIKNMAAKSGWSLCLYCLTRKEFATTSNKKRCARTVA